MWQLLLSLLPRPCKSKPSSMGAKLNILFLNHVCLYWDSVPKIFKCTENFNAKRKGIILCSYFIHTRLSKKIQAVVKLRSESTDVSLLGTSIVVGSIVVGGHHHVTIARGEGVTIGIVQVASSSWVASWVVRKLRHQAGWRAGGVPAGLEGRAGRVGGITVDGVAINEVANLGVCACVSSTGHAAGDLRKKFWS